MVKIDGNSETSRTGHLTGNGWTSLTVGSGPGFESLKTRVNKLRVQYPILDGAGVIMDLASNETSKYVS